MNKDGLDVTSPRGGSFHRADGRGASGGACPRVNRAPSVASATTEFSSRRCNCCFVSRIIALLRGQGGPVVTWSSANLRKCNRRNRRRERGREREREKTRSLLFRCSSARRRRKGRVSKLIRVRYVRVRESLVLPSFTLTGRV